jgi:membrane protein implicated in regulation of membrane protease activity
MQVLRETITYIGLGNVLAIIVFLISVFLAFYFYYRTFFRLVYSVGKIHNNLNEQQSGTTQYVSRILIYNNGRKTLTSAEIEQLEVHSSGSTLEDIRVLNGKESLKITVAKDKLKLDFEHLDSRNAFVFEVKHDGVLTVNGRVSETGKILATEPRGWLWLNLVFLFIIIPFMTYNMYIFVEAKNIDLIPIINFALIFGIFALIRFIHGLLFIPDRVSSKYLGTTDKWDRAFRNEF